MKRIDDAIAFSALGIAIIECTKIYRDTAPSLREVRCATAGDISTRQLILDADILGLIVVVAIGGSGFMLIRRWYPLLLAGSTLLLISAYYRSVLNSSNEGMAV